MCIFIDKKKQELNQVAGDFFRANVPNVTNIYQNLVAQADDATDLTKAISLPENIFGLKPKNTIAANLEQAATDALGAYNELDEEGNVIAVNAYEPGTTAPGPTEYPDEFMGNIHDTLPSKLENYMISSNVLYIMYKVMQKLLKNDFLKKYF